MSFIRHRRATSPNKFECRNYDSKKNFFDTSAVEAVIKLVIEYNPEAIMVINGLTDYKFYCFNGVPKYLYVSNGMDNHETARLSFLTMNWEKAPFGRSDYLEFEVLPPKPTKFDEMVKIAKSLSGGHPFLRVDLYEINNKVYFSELTFSPCGGFMPFVPEEWDAKLGEMVNIRKVK